MLSRTRTAVFCSTLLFALQLHAQPEAAIQLRRGAIVEQARNAAYLAKPNGAIEAIDLESGRALWRSEAAALPLGLVAGRFLVAQIEERLPAARLRLAVLDVQNGGRTVSEAVIALPANVRALAGDREGESFRAIAEDEAGTIVVSWFYQKLELRGVRPAPGEEESNLLVSGTARVVAANGNVTGSSAIPVDAPPARWRAYGSTPRAPWRAGSVSASTEGGRGGPLTLKRTNAVTGQMLPERQISNAAIVALSSADQHHLVVAERVGEGGPDDPEYRWLIFDLETGERVSELRRDVSASPFFVWGDNVIFESSPHGYRSGGVWVERPLELRAVRASSGVPVWDAELRDLAYRGPLPPKR